MRIVNLFCRLPALVCLTARAESMDGLPYEEYEDFCSRLMECTPGPEQGAEFAALPPETRRFYIAACFDMEIQNGGICQFFANYGSDCAVLVSESLRAVGLEPMARLYDEFLSAQNIDPADLSAFAWETVEEFAAIYEKYPESEDFDEAYMDLWTELDFSRTMLEYAKAHLN